MVSAKEMVVCFQLINALNYNTWRLSEYWNHMQFSLELTPPVSLPADSPTMYFDDCSRNLGFIFTIKHLCNYQASVISCLSRTLYSRQLNRGAYHTVTRKDNNNSCMFRVVSVKTAMFSFECTKLRRPKHCQTTVTTDNLLKLSVLYRDETNLNWLFSSTQTAFRS